MWRQKCLSDAPIHLFGAKQAGLLSRRSSALGGVDPGKRNHQADDEKEEQQLDPDCQPDEPPRPPRPGPAPIAVRRVGPQLRPALLTRRLDQHHANEYATSAREEPMTAR